MGLLKVTAHKHVYWPRDDSGIRAAQQRSYLGARALRDRDDVVVTLECIKRGCILRTRRDITQVDIRIVQRDEVEHHCELERIAVQHRYEWLG